MENGPNLADPNGGEEDETVTLDIVEGFPDWRKVDRGDGQIYYFNLLTKETVWELPTE